MSPRTIDLEAALAAGKMDQVPDDLGEIKQLLDAFAGIPPVGGDYDWSYLNFAIARSLLDRLRAGSAAPPRRSGPEHRRTDTYEPVDESYEDRIAVACTCGWRSAAIAPNRDEYGLLTDAVVDELSAHWRGHVALLVTPRSDEVLETRRDGGGIRYHLAGEPVYTGSALDLLMPDGVWISGRLEVEHDSPDPWGADRRPLPIFYTTVGGPAADHNVTDYQQQVHFPLPPDAVLRRPAR